MRIEESGYKGWPHKTYISEDGIEFGDEESCVDHEQNYEKYKEIMENLKISPKLKEFDYETLDTEEESIGLGDFYSETNFIWYKVTNNEEVKAILKANIEYLDSAMEWAEQLQFPDFIGIKPGNVVIYKSFNEISKNTDMFIRDYQKYVKKFREEFMKFM